MTANRITTFFLFFCFISFRVCIRPKVDNALLAPAEKTFLLQAKHNRMPGRQTQKPKLKTPALFARAFKCESLSSLANRGGGYASGNISLSDELAGSSTSDLTAASD